MQVHLYDFFSTRGGLKIHYLWDAKPTYTESLLFLHLGLSVSLGILEPVPRRHQGTTVCHWACPYVEGNESIRPLTKKAIQVLLNPHGITESSPSHGSLLPMVLGTPLHPKWPRTLLGFSHNHLFLLMPHSIAGVTLNCQSGLVMDGLGSLTRQSKNQ